MPTAVACLDAAWESDRPVRRTPASGKRVERGEFDVSLDRVGLDTKASVLFRLEDL